MMKVDAMFNVLSLGHLTLKQSSNVTVHHITSINTVYRNVRVCHVCDTLALAKACDAMLSTSSKIFYRPKHSCGKVMFLHLSVILSTGGCMADTPWQTPNRQTPPPGQTLPS